MPAQRYFRIKDYDGKNHTGNTHIVQWELSEKLCGVEFDLDWGAGGELFFTDGCVRILEANDQAMKIAIFRRDGGIHENPLLLLDLVIGSHPDAPSSRHWYWGAYARPDNVAGYVFLFQRDRVVHNNGYRRRIYIELINHPGAHWMHRPWMGTLFKEVDAPGGPDSSKGAAIADTILSRQSAKWLADGPEGSYVQDDVGTGHERIP
jgi:hypothetical protein